MTGRNRQIQRLGAYGLAQREGSLLVVRASALTEVQGRWFLPGGGVDHGEHPARAMEREVLEETGLRATATELLGVVDDLRTRRTGERVHSVRLIYRLEDYEGELVHESAGSSDEARWVPLDELRSMDLADYVVEAAALVGLDLRPDRRG
jgi:8-oxo-dGTP diphosphatase